MILMLNRQKKLSETCSKNAQFRIYPCYYKMGEQRLFFRFRAEITRYINSCFQKNGYNHVECVKSPNDIRSPYQSHPDKLPT